MELIKRLLTRVNGSIRLGGQYLPIQWAIKWLATLMDLVCLFVICWNKCQMAATNMLALRFGVILVTSKIIASTLVKIATTLVLAEI